jgi:O-antigen ligase
MLLAAGLLTAALFPLTAYAVSPVVVPALLAALAAAVVVLRRPEMGIALAAAVAPVANLTVGGTKPLLPVLPALAFGLLAYAPLVNAGERRRVPGSAIAVLVFVAASVATTLTALSPSDGAADLRWLIIAAALMLATLQVVRTREQVVVAAGGLVTGLLVAALHGLSQRVANRTTDISFAVDGEVVNRISGAFGHPNQYAGYLAVFLPLALTLAVNRSVPPRLRALSAAAFALAVPAMLFAYTRGAVLGVAAGSILWFAVLRPKAAIGVAVLVVAVGAFLTPATLKERFTADSGGDVTLREDIWKASIDLYASNPIVGVGVNNFGNAYETLSSLPAVSSQRRLLHGDQVLVPPHAQNLYLNVLAEQGLIGLLALALVGATAVTAAFRGSRARDPVGRAIALGFGAGLITLALHSMLEVTIFGERLELSLFVLLMLTATVVHIDRSAEAAADDAVADERAAVAAG